MGSNLTLMERLADPGRGARRTVSENAQELADSVMRHLQKLLNTRQGHVQTRPDYGMPDFTDCAESHPETLERVRRAIQASVEAFEPRLRRVRITHLPSDDRLVLHFRITGQLVAGRQEMFTFFSTTVGPSGRAAFVARAEVSESRSGGS